MMAPLPLGLAMMPGLAAMARDKASSRRVGVGETRSLVYVDLEMLSREFQAQYEKNLKI